MARRISSERKTLFYLGRVLMLIGGLSFFSVFVTGCMNFGDFSNFEGDAKSSMFRALLGMALLIAGGALASVGARGLAGSGLILDPEQARGDLEPFARQGGGMVKDALDEAGIAVGRGDGPQIMIRCRACQTLNEEGSKFCQECGEEL